MDSEVIRRAFTTGWRRGYRQGHQAALDKVAHQIATTQRISLNIPVLDAENDYEREARTIRECAE